MRDFGRALEKIKFVAYSLSYAPCNSSAHIISAELCGSPLRMVCYEVPTVSSFKPELSLRASLSSNSDFFACAAVA